MDSPYLSYIEQDEALARAVRPALPLLRRLSADQIETLVFYLKSLHGYYAASENHVQHLSRFEERLAAIRTGAEQVRMQKTAARKLFIAMLLGGVAGALACAALIAAAAGALAFAAGFAAAALGGFAFAEAKFGVAALDAAKAQDRKYFLDCLRSARACNELDWCGLFSHNGVTPSGPQSPADEARTHARIGEMTAQLRTALYNDEYMQYSKPRPERSATLPLEA